MYLVSLSNPSTRNLSLTDATLTTVDLDTSRIVRVDLYRRGALFPKDIQSLTSPLPFFRHRHFTVVERPLYQGHLSAFVLQALLDSSTPPFRFKSERFRLNIWFRGP